MYQFRRSLVDRPDGGFSMMPNMPQQKPCSLKRHVIAWKLGFCATNAMGFRQARYG
jgi:hypothetical protein